MTYFSLQVMVSVWSPHQFPSPRFASPRPLIIEAREMPCFACRWVLFQNQVSDLLSSSSFSLPTFSPKVKSCSCIPRHVPAGSVILHVTASHQETRLILLPDLLISLILPRPPYPRKGCSAVNICLLTHRLPLSRFVPFCRTGRRVLER
jgi:hypothetical protein